MRRCRTRAVGELPRGKITRTPAGIESGSFNAVAKVGQQKFRVPQLCAEKELVHPNIWTRLRR